MSHAGSPTIHIAIPGDNRWFDRRAVLIRGLWILTSAQVLNICHRGITMRIGFTIRFRIDFGKCYRNKDSIDMKHCKDTRTPFRTLSLLSSPGLEPWISRSGRGRESISLHLSNHVSIASTSEAPLLYSDLLGFPWNQDANPALWLGHATLHPGEAGVPMFCWESSPLLLVAALSKVSDYPQPEAGWCSFDSGSRPTLSRSCRCRTLGAPCEAFALAQPRRNDMYFCA